MARTPFDVLQELRDAEVERSARAWVDRQRVVRAADIELQRALSRRVASEQAHHRIEARERVRLEAGFAKVNDLAATDSWRTGARRVEQHLCSEEVAAGGRVAQALEVEAEGHRELMARRAEARSLSRYRERSAQDAARRAELEREEEAADVWLSQRSKEER